MHESHNKGEDRKEEEERGRRAICDGRALGNKGSTQGCGIKKIHRIAGVLQDDKTSRGKGFYLQKLHIDGMHIHKPKWCGSHLKIKASNIASGEKVLA